MTGLTKAQKIVRSLRLRTAYYRPRFIAEDDTDSVSKETADLIDQQALVIRELVEAIEEGAQVNTPDLMEWVAERLIFVHGESPHVDYVLSLRCRADKLRKASENAIAKALP